jgi:hypothetical protein
MKFDEIMQLLNKQKERRKPRHIESRIQQECVRWFRMQYPTYMILSIPNGGSRNAMEAANMRKEGILAGAPDLLIIAERAVLFVEMKSPKGKQQMTQKEFQKNVERLGHIYKVCHSLMEFKFTVERWLKERYGL